MAKSKKSPRKKKDDKPYMPFYIGDWFKAPEIRAMPHANRMVWFEVLCLMWQSDERGYLTINKKPFVITNDITGDITRGEQVLCSMLGVSCDFLQESFRLFKEYGVYSVREDGAIYSRFMLKLVDIQQKRSKAGTKGMESRYNKEDEFVITNDITNDTTNSEYENESHIGSISKEKSKNKKELEGNVRVDEVDQELLLYMYGVNDLEPNQTKTKEMYIVQELIKIWKLHYPEDYIDKQKDFAAALDIAYKIADKHGWKKESVLYENLKPCCDYWARMVISVKQTGWQSDWTICSLKTNFSKVVKQVTNGTKGQYSNNSNRVTVNFSEGQRKPL